MNTAVLVGFLIAVVIAAIGIWMILVYNRLIRRRNMVDSNWGLIDVQLVRRHDLIPNLVRTVHSYAAHERFTFEAVTAARARATAANGPAQKSEAETLLSQALGRLFALAESYPNLRASENFLALQHELTNTENRIAYARQFYNDSVMAYNNDLQSFPNLLIAGPLTFRPREYFAAEIGATSASAVRF